MLHRWVEMAKSIANFSKKQKSLSFLAKPKIFHFGEISLLKDLQQKCTITSNQTLSVSGRQNLVRCDSANSVAKPQGSKKHTKLRSMGKTSRVVVCGMAGVGKTAILEQLIYGNITPSTVRNNVM